MKLDHIAMDVSQTPFPDLFPVWCSTRCSNSLSNSIVKAIRAWESAVGTDGLGDDALEAIWEPYACAVHRALKGYSRTLGHAAAQLPPDDGHTVCLKTSGLVELAALQ
jgi:hypothetical protein